ncbi:hypothetical protein BT96DRAFT_1020899 [Gymnopus androsaceus JB14]|uniref:Uncharacterized protein n=1 Tax=Gymnopus androsaceus JB14 TaxID=1447944 RepID=A0A6A4HIQ8_9AGAR|nr:hypothetical protein BT96DRAFT_1020899 [Gymnopus androsaceus JB14]
MFSKLAIPATVLVALLHTFTGASVGAVPQGGPIIGVPCAGEGAAALPTKYVASIQELGRARVSSPTSFARLTSVMEWVPVIKHPRATEFGP